MILRLWLEKNKETDDSRNGYSPKTVTSSMGTIDLDIPRDRKGDFEPQIVKKNQTDISNIEDQVEWPMADIDI